MKLVERHFIKKTHKFFPSLDAWAFASKNLYNLANYTIRQEFFKSGNPLSYPTLAKQLKETEAYRALPAKVSQQVLLTLSKSWKGFFAGKKSYKENPQKFSAKPHLPGYKNKQYGRNLLVFTTQALSQPALRNGVVKLSKIDVQFPTKQTGVKQVRIIPRPTPRKTSYYIIEVVYEKSPNKAKGLDKTVVAGIDIGLNNLAAVTSNHPCFNPFLINGRPLKAINAFYNKKRSRLQYLLPKGQYKSRQIESLTRTRNCKIDHYLHHASSFLIKTLVSKRIGTLLIGKNDGWKQGINIGKQNNQNFVSVPHSRFVHQLCYKAQLVGIDVILTEESYTSKCSFLDFEPIQKKEIYAGQRVSRGLFRAQNGQFINADINGSANIIRKVIPNAFADGIQAVVVRPIRITPCKAGI